MYLYEYSRKENNYFCNDMYPEDSKCIKDFYKLVILGQIITISLIFMFIFSIIILYKLYK